METLTTTSTSRSSRATSSTVPRPPVFARSGPLPTATHAHRLLHLLAQGHPTRLGFWPAGSYLQQEPDMPNSLWYIETNNHPLLESPSDPNVVPDMVNYRRPTFLERFWELQNVMWETNAGLTDRHAYDSRPQTWPLLKRGINFWTKDHRQIYLMGNPFVWWAPSSRSRLPRRKRSAHAACSTWVRRSQG